MSEKKRLNADIEEEKFNALCDFYHVAGEYAKEKLEKILLILYEKDILNKVSPEAQAPTGESNQTVEQKPRATTDIPANGESPEKKALFERLKQPDPPPPCHFVSEGYTDPKTQIHYIMCDSKARKPKNKNTPVPIPLQSCQQCYSRKEWVKRKQESEQEENPEPTQEEKRIPKPLSPFASASGLQAETREQSTSIDRLKGGTLLYTCEEKRLKYPMKELPCLVDHSLKCPNKTCDDHLTKLIESMTEYPTFNPQT